MCSPVLNPNAKPYLPVRVRTFVVKRPFCPVFPLTFFYQIRSHPKFYPLLWRPPHQPPINSPNPAVISEDPIPKVKPRKTGPGKKKRVAVGPAKPRSSVKTFSLVPAAKWVPKAPKKNLRLPAKERVCAAARMQKSAAVGGGGSGGGDLNVIPFPSPEQLKISGITTLMIKNIPNQIRRGDLMKILSEHCCEENRKAEFQSDPTKSEFDFLYLPMDFEQFWVLRRNTNLGYAFVNFTNSEAALRFYKKFHNWVWDVQFNQKTCEVTCAKIQGLEEMRTNFREKIFRCPTNEYLPAELSPPCDGVSKPELIPVGRLVNVPLRGPVRD